jgi:cyanophycin synthetase
VTDAIAAPVPPLRAAVLAALAARGVPVRALGSSEPPVLLIGQGVKRRMFWRGFTDTTSHVGTVVATSKPLSKALLGGAGLPVPDGGVAADADAAVALSRRIGLPVVVKPAGADLGTGVSADIRHEQAVREAFALARPHGPVLVERHIPGSNHRILIVGGRFVAAVRHTPAQVVGDGVSRIVELVQRVNAGRADTLSPDNKKIVLDDAALWTLKWQGLSLESVPDAGAVVRLRTASNLSKGGTLEAVTDRVHPENRALAERAARVLQLDVAGVDFVSTDIERPWFDSACAIVEVNPTPALLMGEPLGRIEGLFVDAMLPPGDDGRIPTVALLGVRPGLVRAIEGILSAQHCQVAVCDARGVRIGTHLRSRSGGAIDDAIAAALADPQASAALFDLNGAVLRAGGEALDAAGLDRIDVALIPDVAGLPMPLAADLARRADVLLTSGQPEGGRSQEWVASHGAMTRIDGPDSIDRIRMLLAGVVARRRVVQNPM